MATTRRTRLCTGSLFVLALLLLTTASLGGAPAAVADESQASTAALRAFLATQQAKLVASDGAALDQAGWSVALDGDTAIVGAPYDDVGANANRGSAYVFVRSGGAWTQQAKLIASDGAAGDQFGQSVAVSGDTILVGAVADDVGGYANQGSACVFVRSGTTWSQQAQLFSPEGQSWIGFGHSVALDGDTALVGDPFHYAGGQRPGSACVFVRSGTNWSLQQELGADDAATDDQFGYSVALDGDTALIGAPGNNVGTAASHGAAYAFVRSGSSWNQQARVTGSGSAANEWFGDCVALSGDTALVGAPYDHVGTVVDQGSAWVFIRGAGESWALQRKLTVANREPSDDHFGSSVALDGDTALVGADEDEVDFAGGHSHYAQGTASVFVRTGAAWARQATLTSADGDVRDRFGCSVALDGDNALVGAYNDNVSTRADQGSGYVLVGKAPTTTAALKPAANVYGWNRTAVTVTLSAKDVFSGVASTEYRRVGVADWTTYAAPFTVSGNGVKTFEYRSTDRDDHVETTKLLRVRIDTTHPVTYALANVGVAYGGRSVFRLRVNDTVSPKWWGFVKVYRGTTLKQTFNVPETPTNTEIRYPFTCRLPRGTYTWKVFAADLAGNKQSKVGYKMLVVR